MPDYFSGMFLGPQARQDALLDALRRASPAALDAYNQPPPAAPPPPTAEELRQALALRGGQGGVGFAVPPWLSDAGNQFRNAVATGATSARNAVATGATSVRNAVSAGLAQAAAPAEWDGGLQDYSYERPYTPPPPIPGPQDMPQAIPAPTPSFGTGDPIGAKRTLARLAQGDATASNLGINLLSGGEPSGEYADFLARLNARPQTAQPAAAPPAAPQTAAALPSVGANMERQAARAEANPLFQWSQPTSVKPNFHDNLLRFGLAAMAAGGKPMATTLGALGEAGVSTFDANAKAKQSDIENALAGRKVGIAAQNQISLLYERLDKLKADSVNQQLSIAERAERAREARDIQLQIAVLTNQTRQDANRIAEERNEGATADRAAALDQRKAEESRRVEDSVRAEEARLQKEQKDTPMASLGKTPKQLQYERWESLAISHPESRQAQAYMAFKAKEPTLRAQAQAAIAAGRSLADVNKMLTNLGYGPLEQ